MKCEIKNNKLVIELDINEKTSKTGKSLVIASTNGNLVTALQHKGKPVVIGVNAYIAVDKKD
jgi:hypothetical protein